MAVYQDVEAQKKLVLKCRDYEEPKLWSDRDVQAVMSAGMIVLCYSFLSMFIVPGGLQKELGAAAAKEAMDSVEFLAFVALDVASFFASLAAVGVLLQAMTMNISATAMNMVAGICSRLTYVAMGCGGVAFVAAATTFVRHAGCI